MMDVLKDLKWPPALVVIAALGSVVGLYALGAELTAISTFITAVGVAYGAYRLSSAGKSMERVEANTNGANESLRTEITRTKDQMTQMAQDHARVVAQLTAALPAGAPLPSALADNRPPQS